MLTSPLDVPADEEGRHCESKQHQDDDKGDDATTSAALITIAAIAVRLLHSCRGGGREEL
eukprot:CAMPEP_0178434506 /NCGR_PEP_ID=MMETSP0689_2-20121128/33458_1 /TAXON_ID=160604 /ORGANISM="Amphidinium massartii, Strain CS-259" /LENGTH=59 /DNA_ID=CAMNT_0020056571 /DNA_START=351 /DNA_END=527 /DNA_ORIENTATION=-